MFINTGLFKALSYKNTFSLPFSYWCLVVLRFVLTLLPQTGYLHPDEYFQNIEVIAGDIFDIDVARTWEFDLKFPVRSIFLPKLVFGPPFHLIRLLNPYSKTYLNLDLRTPYFLLVIPRLFICCLSFINDYCLYKICVIYGQNFKTRLNIFASSYVIIVYGCRSFSNTFEMLFFSLLLLLVAQCMSMSDKVIYHDEFLREKYEQAKTPVEKVQIFKLQSLLPYHSLTSVSFISLVIVIGFFNRPTFFAFAFPPMFFWLHRGLGSKVVGFKDFNLRILALLICCFPIFMLLILVDSVYYGYLTIADFESMKINWNNWIVTPWNFVKYNMDTKNLANHGIHPHWYHLLTNMPLLFNVLSGFAIVNLLLFIYRFIRGQYSKLPRFQSITGLMLFSLFVPIGILSIFPHQEARFIIPVILPLVYLYGNRLHTNESDSIISKRFKYFLLYSWYTLNLLLTIFFGFVHQGGILAFAHDLHHEIKSTYGTQTHVFVTRSYAIPSFLLQLESSSRVWRDKQTGKRYMVAISTFIYKYGSIPTPALFHNVDDVLSVAEQNLLEKKKKYRMYITFPCSFEEEINQVARSYHYFDLVPAFKYYPHFSYEVIPKFPSVHDQNCAEDYGIRMKSQIVNLTFSQRISCFIRKFCFKVYRVKVK